ncbi:rhodanese-like domain-containing protein [Trichoderma breve]|uniref:M-phase inducer phosphatase n=1 Tax=Trichoderma breve TaxID=2034170 RepID=A0A9W9E6U4_9HYPO|nr:rhodanese-like domain-containing protein [Trichoderma breve]KAJ4858697.1 rhodanese-like domain-containing protein [Trichoderma breve]
MTASSPLAAIHRPVPAPTWGGRDIFRSHYAGNSASGSLSLREQLHKGTGEYLDGKVRGSSPGGSLAADLSQNFRLDNEASPKFTTPRRALFTANVVGSVSSRDFVTTPPLPPSSPSQRTEILESSPLPLKVTFSESSLDLLRSRSRHASLEPAKPIVADRRMATPRRTLSGRAKSIAGIVSGSQPSSLQFGATTSTLSLDECFESDSPEQDRNTPTSSNSPCPAIPIGLRSRSQLASIASINRHGSPGNLHSRRQSNPFLRTRKQFRRSLSMFESPADVMKPKPEKELAAAPILKASVTEIEEAHEPIIPHFLPDDPTDTIPRITRETMLAILDGKYSDKFAQRMVIDCRFEYEYEGGHIDSAVNHNNKELLADQLFQTPMEGLSLLIFHCEYSAHRAPLMARHIRSQDRTINAEHYPRLTYPEIYILDGGYSGFFAEHRARCFPPEYVEMSDEKHQRTCEREMGRLKSRKPFGRAQTFAFGQRSTSLHDSPTGPPRPQSRNVNASPPALSSPAVSAFDSPTIGDRTPARRMASY